MFVPLVNVFHVVYNFIQIIGTFLKLSSNMLPERRQSLHPYTYMLNLLKRENKKGQEKMREEVDM
jgi:hypothetical protein